MKWMRYIWYDLFHKSYEIPKENVGILILTYKRFWSKRKVRVLIEPDIYFPEEYDLGWISAKKLKNLMYDIGDLPDGIALRNYLENFLERDDFMV